MQVDVILIGQGISGTWLSYFLEKAGVSFLVIDEHRKESASGLAAGIINPVTGRRIVKTWMTDELLPYCRDKYAELGNALKKDVIEQKDIFDFFPTPQMRMAFYERFSKDPTYLRIPGNENDQRDYLQYDFGYGTITPCYLVNLPLILKEWRNHLLQTGSLIEQSFDFASMSVRPSRVRYKDITACKIIFCDGIASMNHPYFKNLPFAPNKGEVIWIEAPDLPASNIYKKGMNIVPWSPGIFWVGSSYEWEFDHEQPTDLFREKTTALLKQMLRVPFSIIDHKAGVRPATLERRPFIGFHPLYTDVGIFNGMGTKGCSLSPFFAEQLVANINNAAPLHPEADIGRFSRILLR